MNRRGFLTGLLATTALPVLPKLAGAPAHVGLDLAGGADSSALIILEGNPEIGAGYSWVRQSLGYAVRSAWFDLPIPDNFAPGIPRLSRDLAEFLDDFSIFGNAAIALDDADVPEDDRHILSEGLA